MRDSLPQQLELNVVSLYFKVNQNKTTSIQLFSNDTNLKYSYYQDNVIEKQVCVGMIG